MTFWIGTFAMLFRDALFFVTVSVILFHDAFGDFCPLAFGAGFSFRGLGLFNTRFAEGMSACCLLWVAEYI